MERRDELIRIFSKEIRELLQRSAVDFSKVQEIRMRVQAPLLLVVDGREYFLSGKGQMLRERWSGNSRENSAGEEPGGGADRVRGAGSTAYIVNREAIQETMEYVSRHSLYAFEEEIRQGFLTIPGGHRIGIAGRAVLDEGEIRTIKNISFLNIRLAHQVLGCADAVMPYLFSERGKGWEVLHTLIISPPRCGKTTLLRDIIRQLSDGSQGHAGMTVGVVDERSEIGACYQGMPQNELGIRTDVLDCCPKAKGMMMLVRTMSPQVIAVDEIGGRDDLEALQYVMNCGCKVVATVHGQSLEDIRQKPILRNMLDGRMFERYLVLDDQGGAGHVSQICDAEGRIICG